MQTIGLAEFRTNPTGGLVLNAFQLTELLADPAAEASRVAQMKIAVQEMTAGLKIKAGRVNYAIPAQSVFTRFVRLPAVEADKVDQIITFEAQQNVPFPIEEVVWDYQLVGGEETGRYEVVLVAIKADLLDELNNAVEDSGLTTGVVDVGPMALYNAFRYNYSDAAGCSLLIDIGARTTNLIFIEPRKIFSRSIPIGGTQITTNIAKEFNEPFGAAEERKRNTGFVSLGGAYAEPSDPEVARVSKIVRNTMTRLHAEITRSISFYRSQQGGGAPARVYLCGGSVGMPYMREFFTEKLQLPIEFFNPLRNVSVSNGVNLDDASKSARVLGELVGLALRSVGSCPMELNLRPASVERAQRLAQKRPYLIMAAVCVLLSLAGWWLYFMRAADVENTVTSQLQEKIAPLKQFENQIDAARKDIASAQATAAPYINAVDDRDFWVRAIDDFNARLPERFIWVTTFEPTNAVQMSGAAAGTDAEGSPAEGSAAEATPTPLVKPGAGGKPGIYLKGLYVENPQGAGIVDQFQKNLSASPFVRNVTEKTRQPPDGATWAYNFELTVELKQAPSQEPAAATR